MVGSAGRLTYADTLIWPAIMYPVIVLKKAPALEQHERQSGQVALKCIEYHFDRLTPPDAYCLDRERPMLRASAESGYSEIFNRVGIFQHRFSAEQIVIREDQQAVLQLDQDVLRGMMAADEQELTPPAGARKVERVKNAQGSDATSVGGTAELQASARVLAGHPIAQTAPIYPATAKQRRTQGSVRIAATIGKDGLVLTPVVVHDPDGQLSQAALDAVSKWRYTPYLIDGVPVEVQTTIRVTFRLGG